MFESIIHTSGKENELLLECCENGLDGFMSNLMRFKMRSQVEFQETDLQIISSYHALNDEKFESRILSSSIDPRVAAMGYRSVTSDASKLDNDDNYTRRRMKLGIPEGTAEMPVGKELPQEFNFDYMNGSKFFDRTK